MSCENCRCLELQVSEVTAHRDRLRDMLNRIRGLVWKEAYGPKDHAIEARIMEIIEGPAEERCKCGAAPQFWCPGKSDQIPERLFHPAHHSCMPCDKGVGCAMIGERPRNWADTHRAGDDIEKRNDLCPPYICPLCYHHVNSHEHEVCQKERQGT